MTDAKQYASLREYTDSWVGVPYVWGDSSRCGTDGSGYIMNVYKDMYGVELRHKSSMIYDDPRFEPVDAADLKEGDLVFYGDGLGVDHVGVYMGDSTISHASTSTGVAYMKLDNDHWKDKYKGARRLKKGGETAEAVSAPVQESAKACTSDSAVTDAKQYASLREYTDSWVGVPYVWGDSSRCGTDGSGYIMNVYKDMFGVELPHKLVEIYDDPRFEPVEPADLKEGDLVFYGDARWSINHVGIYMGDGTISHATTSQGVMYTKLSNSYWAPKCKGARRLKKGGETAEGVSAPVQESAKADTSDSAVADAKQYATLREYTDSWLGVRYVFGGASREGTDASGYIMNVYKDMFGVELPHKLIEIYDDPRFEPVELADLKEGDLVFYGAIHSVDHVGIYVGDGTFSHVSTSTGVAYMKLDNANWAPKCKGARRLKKQ